MTLLDAFWHGAFVFTTLRLERGQVLWQQEHFDRLKHHSEDLGLGFTGFEQLELEVAKYQNTAGLNLLRLVVSGNYVGSSIRPLIAPMSEQYTQGVNVHISRIQIHPQLGRYKTGNHLPYRLAKKEADEVGAFEGLLLDALGNVVDGSRSSLLLFQDETLYSLSGGLEGITRQKILDKARELGIKTNRAYFKPKDISGQLLLAGTGMGLVPVGVAKPELIQLIQEFRVR
jgi:branched-subunit amino acid aminotransferase/4-amino-4-deoxychorismate lyase